MTAIWIIIGILVGGAYAIYSLVRSKGKVKSRSDNDDAIRDFLSSSKKYEVSFDNCVFKNSSYLSEEEQRNPNLAAAGAFIGSPVSLYYTPVERVENIQSALIYEDESIAKGMRFFQTFPMDEVTLKYHAMMGHLELHVDMDDLTRYYFNLTNKPSKDL